MRTELFKAIYCLMKNQEFVRTADSNIINFGNGLCYIHFYVLVPTAVKFNRKFPSEREKSLHHLVRYSNFFTPEKKFNHNYLKSSKLDIR